MSGGSMNYFAFTFDEPLAIISKEIKWGKNKWTPEALLEFQNAVNYLKLAQIYSRRVEWLLSGDDGENSFIKRLKEELEENRKNPELIEPQLKNVLSAKTLTARHVNIVLIYRTGISIIPNGKKLAERATRRD